MLKYRKACGEKFENIRIENVCSIHRMDDEFLEICFYNEEKACYEYRDTELNILIETKKSGVVKTSDGKSFPLKSITEISVGNGFHLDFKVGADWLSTITLRCEVFSNNIIRNFTPHDVNLFRMCDCWYDQQSRKYRSSGQPYKVFPSEGILSVRLEQAENACMSEAVNGIPIYSMRCYGGDTKLPEPITTMGEEYFIVSRLFKDNTMIKNRRRCLTTGPAVVNEKGQIIGCVGLVF